MRFKMRQLLFLAIFSSVFTALFLHGRNVIFAAGDTMDITEIVPGMTGYGKTVFTGDRIDIFHVEVLGILRHWDAKSNLILVRMSGGPLEKSGIIAGMSGSPVYIDNRLIGAVSYGWSFAKEPIAGITPIQEMKNTLLNKATEERKVSMASTDWELPPSSFDKTSLEPQIAPFIQPEISTQDSPELRLTPILSPLIISGVNSEVLHKMQPFFQTHGLCPMQGGSYISADDTTKRPTLEPGSSVAAILIKGDLSAAAVGTVTYTEGNQVLAFGHPFLQTGATDLPMATAHVYTILSSQSNSIKMASPVEVVGRINRDGRPGIAGTLKEASRMIPCHIEVEGSQKLSYNFEIADNKLLTPSLMMMVAHSAVLATEKKLGEKTAHIKLSVQIDGYEKPVEVENIFYELDQSWFPINLIIQPFAMIMNNQFQKVRVNRIEMNIHVMDTRQTANIEAIKVDKKQVKPGDTLQVDVRLKPFTGESFYQTVMVNIPEDTLPGSMLNVTACDATFGNALNMGRSAGKYLPTNFDQLLHYMENLERNNNLMVRVLLTKKGLTYRGEGFPSLPGSIHSIMSLSNQSGVGPLSDEVISRTPTTYVLTGNKSIPVFVK